VTLSPAAREQAAPASSPQSVMSQIVHTNPESATQITRDFAYNEDRPRLDMSDFFAGKGPMKYFGTGEPVTEESETRFASVSAKVRDGRIALYESEKAKGTAPADIDDLMASYMDKQSPEYLGRLGWNSPEK
jgi:hypothetical protein